MRCFHNFLRISKYAKLVEGEQLTSTHVKYGGKHLAGPKGAEGSSVGDHRE